MKKEVKSPKEHLYPTLKDRRTFSIKTLGCKVNQYESQAIREKLIYLGFIEAPISSEGIVIVNTCTVTSIAERKARQFIRSLKRKYPGVLVVVTGCSAVIPRDIEAIRSMPEVDAVIPGPKKMDIKEYPVFSGPADNLNDHHENNIKFFEGHKRAFVKVQDGCDNSCSYCKVTVVRGRSVSRSIEDIVAEVRDLYRNGYKEIVLSGICIGSWSDKSGAGLEKLIMKVSGLKGDFRIRISSIEPLYLRDDLIKAFSDSEKMCPHLHIPLQSGSDMILSAMNRGYTAEKFVDIVRKIKKARPGTGISTDVITGFPGETPEDLELTLKTLEDIKPVRLHVFRFSPREGTKAAEMRPFVAAGESAKRADILIKHGIRFQKYFIKQLKGKEVAVLVEKSDRDTGEGYSGEYARVRITGEGLVPGEILSCRGIGSCLDGTVLDAVTMP